MFIEKVSQALKRKKVPFAVAGGWAVALHGAVRGTVDVDIVIRLEKQYFLAAEKALGRLGLTSRLPLNGAEVFDFRKEYIQNKHMAAWNFVNKKNPSEEVDILITEDLKNCKIQNISTGSASLPILSIKDLIRLKEKSRRPQDMEDIKALKRIQK